MAGERVEYNGVTGNETGRSRDYANGTQPSIGQSSTARETRESLEKEDYDKEKPSTNASRATLSRSTSSSTVASESVIPTSRPQSSHNPRASPISPARSRFSRISSRFSHISRTRQDDLDGVDLEKLESQVPGQEITPPDEKDPNIIEWDGPDDPENPMNFSRRRKWTMTILLGFVTFCITFASSVFSTATVITARKFGVSNEVMILGTSLFVLVCSPL